MSNPEIAVKITADSSGMNAGVSQSESALDRLVQEVQRSNAAMQQGFMQSQLALREIARASGETAESITRMQTQTRPAAHGMTMSFGAIGLAISGIKQSIELVGQAIKTALGPSAEMQRLNVQFGVLLGSVGEAKKRVQELTKFSDETPFELPEVAKADKVLENLTKGALSGRDGLTLVGDAAAATGEPFDDLAVWVGRLYDGLQSGRPVGEAMQRLQELGIMSGETRAEIEHLQKEGKKGPEVWSVAEKALGQYAGMMKAQSQTFEGLSSTMKDSLGSVMRDFGDQILPAASGATQDLTAMLIDLKPAAQALGWVVGALVKEFRVAFMGFKAVGQDLIPLVVAELGRALAWGLEKVIGFAEKVNGIFGSVLPASMSKGITDGLASAKEWAQGVGGSMKDLADSSVEHLGTVRDNMAAVYADPEEIAVPGKKAKGKAFKGTDKKAEKAAKDAEAERIRQLETDRKMAAEEIKIAREKDKLLAESETDEVERLRALRALQYRDEVDKAQGNKQLLLAVNAKYAADLKDIEIKAAEKASAESQKRLKKAEDAQKKYLDSLKPQFEVIKNLAATLSDAFAGVSKSLVSMAIKGDFTLRAMGQAIKNMLVEMAANVASFVVKTMAEVAILATADALTGGIVSAVLSGMNGGKGTGGILGFATGGLLSFDVGTPSVPRDMVAKIHQGEMIIPKTFAEGIRKGEVPLGGGASSHSASLVLPDDILAAIASKGGALVKIINNQGRVSFA